MGCCAENSVQSRRPARSHVDGSLDQLAAEEVVSSGSLRLVRFWIYFASKAKTICWARERDVSRMAKLNNRKDGIALR